MNYSQVTRQFLQQYYTVGNATELHKKYFMRISSSLHIGSKRIMKFASYNLMRFSLDFKCTVNNDNRCCFYIMPPTKKDNEAAEVSKASNVRTSKFSRFLNSALF